MQSIILGARFVGADSVTLILETTFSGGKDYQINSPKRPAWDQARRFLVTVSRILSVSVLLTTGPTGQ